MERLPKLSEEERKVLQAVRRSAMDGYSLLSTTRLDAPTLVNTLVSLQNLLTIKGELTDARVGEAYVALPPGNRNFVDLVLAS